MTDTVIYTNKQSSAHYEIKENSNEVQAPNPRLVPDSYSVPNPSPVSTGLKLEIHPKSDHFLLSSLHQFLCIHHCIHQFLSGFISTALELTTLTLLTILQAIFSLCKSLSFIVSLLYAPLGVRQRQWVCMWLYFFHLAHSLGCSACHSPFSS